MLELLRHGYVMIRLLRYNNVMILMTHFGSKQLKYRQMKYRMTHKLRNSYVSTFNYVILNP